MKIKFGTEIIFSKIKKTNHLIDKKNRRLKYTFQIKSKAQTILPALFYFNPLFFNSILP